MFHPSWELRFPEFPHYNIFFDHESLEVFSFYCVFIKAPFLPLPTECPGCTESCQRDCLCTSDFSESENAASLLHTAVLAVCGPILLYIIT